MTQGDVVAKFRDCLAYAKHPISAKQTDALIEALLTIEQAADVRDVAALLP